MHTRLPDVRYTLLTGISENGTPVATLTFPDAVTANWAVKQLDGKQHSNMQLSLQPDGSPCSAGQGLRPLGGPQQGQDACQPSNRLPPVLSQAGRIAAQHGMPAPPPPPRPSLAGARQARIPFRALSCNNQSGSVAACVQACHDRPALVKLIHRHLTARAGETLRDVEDLKIKLRNMQVRPSIRSVASLISDLVVLGDPGTCLSEISMSVRACQASKRTCNLTLDCYKMAKLSFESAWPMTWMFQCRWYTTLPDLYRQELLRCKAPGT